MNDNCSCGIVLQARMGSTRFPGKVLAPLDGRTMLAVIIERIRKVQGVRLIILATTSLPEDDCLVQVASEAGLGVYRGSQNNLIERYYGAACQFGLNNILRVTADNPLVDYSEASRVISEHLRTGADYTTNRSESGSGMPDGCGVELFTFPALERIHQRAVLPNELEHINDYIFHHPDEFSVQLVEAPPALRRENYSLTVDTPEQWSGMQELYRRLGDSPRPLPLSDVINLLDKGSRNL